jgi:6-phosphogluconolactonase
MTDERRLMAYVSCDRVQHIEAFEIHGAGGALTRRGTTAMPADPAPPPDPSLPGGSMRTNGAPMARSACGRFLYAAMAAKPTRVLSYAIHAETGALDLLAVAPTPVGTVYTLADGSGRFLLGAAYHARSVWVSPIGSDGAIAAEPLHVVDDHVSPHCVLAHPDNAVVYVADTGLPEIRIYDFDAASGRLAPREGPQGCAADATCTPRHMALHPGTGFLYCMNETSGIIDAYRIDAASGALQKIQSFDPRPERAGAPGLGADIRVTPDGRFLYASERAHDTISGFAIDPSSGMLTPIGTTQVDRTPRNIAIDPDGRFLIVAGQLAGGIGIYAIGEHGALSRNGFYPTDGAPIWIEIVDLARIY